MAAAPVRRALGRETNGNAAGVSGRQMERSPSKALTDAYAQPSKIPKFNQASTSTGSLQRQASRGIQCHSSQPKLDLQTGQCLHDALSTASVPSQSLHSDISLHHTASMKHACMTCSVVLLATKTAPCFKAHQQHNAALEGVKFLDQLHLSRITCKAILLFQTRLDSVGHLLLTHCRKCSLNANSTCH